MEPQINRTANTMGWIWILSNIPFIPFAGSLVGLLFVAIGIQNFEGTSGVGPTFVQPVLSFLIFIYLYRKNRKNGKQRLVNILAVLLFTLNLLSTLNTNSSNISLSGSDSLIGPFLIAVIVGATICSFIVISIIRFFKR